MEKQKLVDNMFDWRTLSHTDYSAFKYLRQPAIPIRYFSGQLSMHLTGLFPSC
jgi:hypothetical protein